MASPLTSGEGAQPGTPEEAAALLGQIAQAGRGLGLLVRSDLLRLDGRQTLAERRYRALIEQIPVVTFLAALDEDVQELYVSPQIQELLGFTQREWLENPFLWYNQLHPDDRQRWADQFAQTCATGTQFRSEYRFIARDGRVVWVHGECQLIRDEHGAPLFLQGVAYDITEIKNAQEVLQNTSRKLELRVQERTAELRQEVQRRQQIADQLTNEGRQKDQFLAVLAHELRNPLAPIVPALDVLREEQTGPEDRRWAIDMIGRQVRQMSKLIDDLLDVSRISRGKISLDQSLLDLTELVNRAIEVVRPLFQKRQHKLTFQQLAGPIPVSGDPVRLEQIITNLLNNAAKFTPLGGLIEVELGREQGSAVLRVRDNGIGIPPEMQEKIFEMFTQVDTSAARATQSGLGIGLALVHGLVQLHGGSIAATSPGVGQGSEFTMWLPLVPSANLGSKPGAVPGLTQALPRRRILVVEDNSDIALALTLMLRAWGQEVRTVHDGASALSEIRTDPPQIVFLDIGLPGMNGYEVARQIRQDSAGGRMILAAVTGYGQPEDRQRALDAGFDFHFTKPVQVEAVRDLLALNEGAAGDKR